MSKAGGKSGSTGRSVTSDEAELWDFATRSAAPIKAKQRVTEGGPTAPAKPAPPAPTPKKAKAAPPAPPPQPPPAKQPARLPPLADLDRRKLRQIASGKLEIEARIDLHGLRQADAAQRLRTFLIDAHARGLRTVLVITGKGGEPDRGDHMTGAFGEPRRGVLRRNVPAWLEGPELRSVVLGYTTAGIKHGGEGALYVQLRKRPQHHDG